MPIVSPEQFNLFLQHLNAQSTNALHQLEKSYFGDSLSNDDLQLTVQNFVKDRLFKGKESEIENFITKVKSLKTNTSNQEVKDYFHRLAQPAKLIKKIKPIESNKCLGTYKTYLLMNASPVFLSLFTGSSQEARASLNNLSEEAFNQIIQDLDNLKEANTLENLFKRVVNYSRTLQERVSFCNQQGVKTLINQYENERRLQEELLCRLVREASIEDVLKIDRTHGEFKKLKKACKEKIQDFFADAIQAATLKDFQQTLQSLKPHAASIESLDLREVFIPNGYLQVLIQNLPNLKRLSLAPDVLAHVKVLNTLEINQMASHLSELKDKCQKEIEKFLKMAIDLSRLEEALSQFKPYAKAITSLSLCELPLSLRDLESIGRALPDLERLACPIDIKKIFLSLDLSMFSKLTSLDLRSCDISDEDLKQILLHFPSLTSINLSYCKITDLGLDDLSKLPLLQSLNLTGCYKITDKGVESLSKRTSLTSLNLTYCSNITDVSLAHLSHLSHLVSLELEHCKEITDIGLSKLSSLKNLQILNLFRCEKITDEGVKDLSSLIHLIKLDLGYCSMITDDGLKQLALLNSLTELNLRGCSRISDQGLRYLSSLRFHLLDLYECHKITDSGFQCLSFLDQLQKLSLGCCPLITDSSLRRLSFCPLLSHLELSKCSITGEGVKSISFLKELASLILDNCDKLRDDDLANLFGLPHLSYLSLNDCEGITNDAIEDFSSWMTHTRVYHETHFNDEE